MKFIHLALLSIALLPALALAGANRDRGESGPTPDEGPGYVGLVLDAAGKPVEDARVSASHRDGPALVTRSNAAGVFNLPEFMGRQWPDWSPWLGAVLYGAISIWLGYLGWRKGAVSREA